MRVVGSARTDSPRVPVWPSRAHGDCVVREIGGACGYLPAKGWIMVRYSRISSASQGASGTTRSVEASDFGVPCFHCRSLRWLVRTTRILPTVPGISDRVMSLT